MAPVNRKGRRGSWTALALALLMAATPPLQAAEWAGGFTPSVNDFGNTGLLQMPNARFHEDGEVNLGVSYIDPYTRGFFTVQGLPWLEGTFRYTDISNRLFSSNREFSGNQSFKDRSVDLKVLWLEESSIFPQIALGLRDLGGTDLFGSEFLVASKRYYDWDFTLGLAWGNGGSRGHLPNPFCEVSSNFCERGDNDGPGGFGFDFFRGERIAIFGGIEYLTPIDGLRLKLEYDGNDYQSEPLGNEFDAPLPINVGAEYDLLSWFRVSAAFERGNQFMVRGNIHTNLNKAGVPKIEPPPPKLVPRQDQYQEAALPASANGALQSARRNGISVMGSSGEAVAVDRVLESLQEMGLQASSLDFVGRTAVVRVPVESGRPSDATLAQAGLKVGRMDFVGPVERVEFVATRDGLDVAHTSFDVADLERSMSLTGSAVALAPTPARAWPAAFDAGAPDVVLASAGGSALPAGVRRRNREISDQRLQSVAQKVFDELDQIDFKGQRLDIKGQRATLYFTQSKYRNPAKAIGRAARVLARNAPPHVEELSLVITEIGIPISQTTILRKDLEQAVVYQGSPEEIWQHAVVEAAAPETNDGVVNDDRFPAFNWSLRPALRQHIGGPDAFYFFQIYGRLAGEVQVMPGLTVGGAFGVNVFNNFNDLKLESNSQLPRVRSDIAEYLRQGNRWIDSLSASYIVKLAPDWYGRVSGGILELMFVGAGGEVLYRPVGKRWAVGLDLNYARQRDFDGLLGLQNYDVVTGHLSYYHRLPWYDILATVRVGRYLAKDWGGTLELSRTFANGATVGAFATKTNVSAEEFGEGRFDKGFFVSFPLDLFFTTPSRSRAGLLFRPLTRDGGQRLAIPKPLYSITGHGDAGRIHRGWDEVLD